MARTTATNFTGGLQFPYATAAADLWKKEDDQTVAIALDQHDHSTGKGLVVSIAAGATSGEAYGALTSSQSTTSSSMVAIPSASVSFTSTTANVNMHFSLGCLLSVSTTASFACRVDGGAWNEVAVISAPTASTYFGVAAFYKFSPAPGAHTYDLGWSTGAGTLQFNAAVNQFLRVWELRK